MPTKDLLNQSGSDDNDDSGSDSDGSAASQGGSPQSQNDADSPKRGPRSSGGSPRSSRSPAQSPRSRSSRSRSGSPARSRKSGSRSRSGSPMSRSASSRSSRSRSPSSERSRSKSPVGSTKTGSRSPDSPRARSASHSPRKSRSRSASHSPRRSRSRSGSPSPRRSRSRSASHSPRRSRSRSETPVKTRSRSPSRTPKSRSGSRSSRSGSRSSRASSAGSHASSKSGNSPKRHGSTSPSPSGVSAVSKSQETRIPAGSGGESPDSRSVVSEAQKSKPAAAAAEIFGDADDISSSDSEGDVKMKSDDENKQKSENESLEKMEVDGSDEETEKKPVEDTNDAQSDAGSKRGAGSDVEQEVEEPPPETRIDVEIPKISTDLGKAIHFVKLPNFLSVEPRPFDPTTYEDEIDDEETLDEEGRARLKLKVENTIRWRQRFNDKGEFVKESNARFVRWSDGSLSLHLGSEIFNVYKQPLQGDHNHLFIRQGTGLQGQAVFRTKLTFRPHSTESFTHRKMTLSLADRSQKTQGIKVISTVGSNPEARREEMLKQEEDRLRASLRRESKQRRVRERVTGRGGGLSASYLEHDLDDDDDENVISLSAIKNRYKGGKPAGQKSRANIYSSDDDDDDGASDVEDGLKARKLEKAKALKMSDDEDDENAPSTSKGEGTGGGGGGDHHSGGDQRRQDSFSESDKDSE